MTRGRFVSLSGDWLPRVRDVLDATDSAETPVVDVVSYPSVTSRGFEGGHQRTEVCRYAEPLPLDRYDTGERSFRVERVTRPLYRRES